MISKYSIVDYEKLKDDIRQYIFLHNMDYKTLADKAGYGYHSIAVFMSNKKPKSRFIASELIKICELNKADYIS